MTIPPESIAVGKCYLSDEGRVRRVVKFISDNQIRYAYRSFPQKGKLWRTGRLEVGRFAETTLREVPCDWTPETDEQA
jgi:hypothetical protein